MTSSRGSSQPRDQTQVSSCLLHWQLGSLALAPLGSPAGSTAHEYSACGEVFGVWTLSIHPAGGGLSLYRGAVTEGQVAGTWPSLDVLS